MLGVVHHAGATVQAHAHTFFKLLLAMEPDMGLGLGHDFTQRAPQRQRVFQGGVQRILGKLHQTLRNLATAAHRRLLGVAVDRTTHIVLCLLGQGLQQITRDLTLHRGTKTNGIGHAVAFGNAVMRPVRRQVQHVTRFQHKLLLGHKVGQNFHRHIRHQAQILLAANAPVAAALGLQQEHVVAVKVRAHAAGIGGIADHQIVQARIRHKTELVHQLVHALVVQVHALHQHGPAGLLEGRVVLARKRPVLEPPLALFVGLGLHHQARLHIVLRRQVDQFGAVQQRFEAGNGRADQQRLFLPVHAHKGLGRDAA